MSMPKARRTTAFIGLGSVVAFILLLAVIPQLPYFHLLPWVETEMSFTPTPPHNRPLVLLLFVLVVFLPLNGMVIFWGCYRYLLFWGQWSWLEVVSGFWLNASFMSAIGVTCLAIYGEFYSTATDLPMIANALFLMFVFWGLSLDFSVLVLMIRTFQVKWLSPTLRWVGLGLTFLQIFLDLAVIQPNIPFWIYAFAPLPLPSFIIIISAYWFINSHSKPTPPISDATFKLPTKGFTN